MIHLQRLGEPRLWTYSAFHHCREKIDNFSRPQCALWVSAKAKYKTNTFPADNLINVKHELLIKITRHLKSLVIFRLFSKVIAKPSKTANTYLIAAFMNIIAFLSVSLLTSSHLYALPRVRSQNPLYQISMVHRFDIYREMHS